MLFLSHVWSNSYFYKKSIKTLGGEKVKLFKQDNQKLKNTMNNKQETNNQRNKGIHV